MRDRSPGIKNSDTKACSLQFDYNSGFALNTATTFSSGEITVGRPTRK
jgi:hypothetical protein